MSAEDVGPVPRVAPTRADSAAALDVLVERVADALAERPTNALLDAAGAGRLLSVPASWVLAEARADRIPHIRLGRYVRFDREELAVWVQARARGPAVRRAGSQPVLRGGDR